jgi:DUF971 family protein
MFTWKIIKITANGELITHAFYNALANDGEQTVSVEGNHWFSDQTIKIPFDDVKEQDIIDWIRLETSVGEDNLIELDLKNQLKALKLEEVDLPWLPKKFRLRI